MTIGEVSGDIFPGLFRVVGAGDRAEDSGGRGCCSAARAELGRCCLRQVMAGRASDIAFPSRLGLHNLAFTGT